MTRREDVLDIIKVYKKAWETRNPELITKIFTKNARYHERAFEKPFIGHNQISEYWKRKVVGEQKNIMFRPLKLYLFKNTAILEWEAKFYNAKKHYNTKMRAVMIIELKGSKIASLKEYWSSVHTRNGAIIKS